MNEDGKTSGGPALPVSEAIARAFATPMPPQRLPFHYRLGMFITAAVLVLLVLTYVGMIAGLGGAIYWYAVHARVIVEKKVSIATLALYLGPMVAGAAVILFMVKPLLAPAGGRSATRAVKETEAPELWTFIRRLCRAVGAPAPGAIELDAEVNAAAGFRRGLLGFLTNDLTLRIGMPLISGLGLRGLAGVLAHEFGHFSQGAAMRVGYVINSVNFWFVRVVYERDSWDQALANWAKDGDIRVVIVMNLVRAAIWLSRRILWVLMLLGRIASCYLSRQMEFDADRREIWLAGSKNFGETQRRAIELSFASRLAQADLASFWNEKRLPDDWAGLVVHNLPQLPKEARKDLEKEISTVGTGWFDTHPASRDRIARAEAEAAPGVLQTDAPAQALFRDFSALSREVTLNLYRELNVPFSPQDIHPLAELVSRQEKELAELKVLRRFLRGQLSPLRPLGIPAALPAAGGAAAALEDLRRTREELLRALPAYQQAFKKYDDLDTRAMEVGQAEALVRAGFTITPSEFHLRSAASAGPAGARALRQQLDREQQVLTGQLQVFEEAARRRLLAALSLLESPALVSRLPQGRLEAARLLVAANRLEPLLVKSLELRNTRAQLGILGAQFTDKQPPETLVRAVISVCSRIRSELTKLREALGATPYPFEHSRGEISLRDFAIPSVAATDNPSELDSQALKALNLLAQTYFRCLGRLATIAEQVETEAGLTPLPDPPEEEAKPETE